MPEFYLSYRNNSYCSISLPVPPRPDPQQMREKRYESLVTGLPSLFLDDISPNHGKNLRRLLEHSPLEVKKVVVWHDVVRPLLATESTFIAHPVSMS